MKSKYNKPSEMGVGAVDKGILFSRLFLGPNYPAEKKSRRQEPSGSSPLQKHQPH